MKKGTYIGTILLGTLILSLVGLYNGYPLVYSDTGTYIFSGFDGFIPRDRPVTYGLFLKFFSLRTSLWSVIFVQNLITAYVIFEVLKLFKFSKKKIITIYIFSLLFLVFFTSIGWYTNQIIPDFFAPLSVLLVFVLIWKDYSNIIHTIILFFLLLISLITHFSHLLIGSVLMMLIFALNHFSSVYLSDLSRKRIFSVTLIVISSWFLLPGINYSVEGKFILSKGTHVFLMAHLNDTGILKQFLEENCENNNYQLCEYTDQLPPSLSAFLWQGNILKNTGGWEASKKEYNEIIYATLKDPKYLLLNIKKSILYGMIQLTKNETGQGLTPYSTGSPPYDQISWKFPNEVNQYLNSRQNWGGGAALNLSFFNHFHQFILIISLFGLSMILLTGFRIKLHRTTLELLIFIIFAVVLNSFVTAGLNSPCARFQSRIVSLVPFALLIVLIKNHRVITEQFFKLLKNKFPGEG